MNHLIYFLGKVILSIFPILIGLAIISLVIALIIFPLKKITEIGALLLLKFIFIPYSYIYAFISAYYYKLYEVYSNIFEKNWMIYITCLVGILFISWQFSAEQGRLQKKLIRLNPLGNTKVEIPDDIFKYVFQIHLLKSSWVMLIAFIIFTFKPNWIFKVYGNIPDFFARLFF